MSVAQLDHEPRTEVTPRARTTVFGLTWVAYASLYFGRKAFPVVKSTLQEKLGLSRDMLGAIDTGYLTAYAIGQFFNGFVGDRIGSRRLLGIGLLGAGAACAAFGLTSTAVYFFVAYVLNGFFQSAGWPGCVKVMGQWFTPKERGAVMGVWSTCYQVGGLVATAAATFLFVHFGWRWAFVGPAALIAFVGIVNFLMLPERAQSTASSNQDNTPGANAHWELFRSPVLWSLGTAYFCLKLIRYSILFWLPYYLDKGLGYSKAQAGYQSISFEVGGVLGAICTGLISDRYFPGRRRTISAIMVAGLAGAFLLYIKLSPISVLLNFLGMMLVGFCLFGPDTIVAGAAAQDLGGKHNVAKAAGFINGLGSVGAILQGQVTSRVSEKYGWNALFYVFVALALMSCVALLLRKRRAVEESAK